MCERQVRALKLPVLRQETFTLHTFGSAASTITKCNTQKLVLENIGDKRKRIETEVTETYKSALL